MEDTRDIATILHNETLFSLSNGHIGTRGSLEEGHRTPEYTYCEGTYINGFYDTKDIEYAEWAYGYAKEEQTIISLPNPKKLEIKLGNDIFDLNTGKLLSHKRILDLKKGTLRRIFEWENLSEEKIKVEVERFISFSYPEILAQRISITPLQSDVNLTVTASIDDLCDENLSIKSQNADVDPRRRNNLFRRFSSKIINHDHFTSLFIKSDNSNLNTVLSSLSSVNVNPLNFNKKNLSEIWEFRTVKNKTIVLDRFIGYGSILKNDVEMFSELKRLNSILNKVNSLGFEDLRNKHFEFMSEFWEKSDVIIEGDSKLQLGLRFNIFHLNQAAGRDGSRNISAKGITGEGYEGHYFWDTEMYMIPFFIFTQPEIAKKLLLFRHKILPEARLRAKELGVSQGALFPWRTINGKEASAYYPAGTAQVHINADIAYAVYTYIQATNDQKFAFNEGLEILIETARFWNEYGHYDSQKNNLFVINKVTGPDEYTAIVNNNFYTNYMAKFNLAYAAKMAKKAISKNNNNINSILEKLNFDYSEVEDWLYASSNMYLPYDSKSKLTMQDDSFFDLKLWDFENTPKENYPLLLNYHPLTIYRYQVNKQADTILAQFLFSQNFDLDQKKRDFNYYEKISTHDSSLSKSVYSMMACDIGKLDQAYDFFMDTALMDLSDHQGNTKDGVHAANMGGSWMSLVYGFAGLKIYDNELHFSTKLPSKWSRLSFNIEFHNSTVAVDIRKGKTKYSLKDGEEISLYHNENPIYLSKDSPYHIVKI